MLSVICCIPIHRLAPDILLRNWLGRGLRAEGVSIGARDRVVVRASELAIIRGVLLFPCLGVETAISSLWYIVLAQEIGVKELTCVEATIGPGMTAVVASGRLAGTGAFASVVDTGKELLTNVIARSVDSSPQLGWAIKTRLSAGWVVLGVAIGPGDHDLEFTSVLALVLGGFLGDTGAPECAFDVGEGCWGWAISSRGKGRVSFEVDVEGSAEVGGVAELLAFDGVVRLECRHAHVGVGIHRGLKVLEGGGVALRRLVAGSIGGISEDLISQESGDCIFFWLGSEAVWLGRTGIVDTSLSELAIGQILGCLRGCLSLGSWLAVSNRLVLSIHWWTCQGRGIRGVDDIKVEELGAR